ncbi:MAG: hypothetical protein MUF15_07375 [Acidobacteria bacterium]|jgi:hypothetical protein|nr:hypothetical protein [Acidobacteriota bacterium]
MADIVSKNPLVRKIFENCAGPDLIELLLNRQMPFTEEEYLESLVFLLRDEKLKEKAALLLKEIPGNVRASYIEKLEANQRVAYHIIMDALAEKNKSIISKAIRNQAIPFEFLLKIGAHGTPEMLEALLDNQVKLIAYPGILNEMEKNPQVTNFVKGKIHEFREFYLTAEVEKIPEESVIEDVKEIIIQEQKQSSQVKTPGEKPGEEKPGEESIKQEGDLAIEKVAQKAMNALQEINSMNIAERIKLALSGSKTQRMILIKDSNKMVSLAVLESPKISIDEVLLLARNRSVAGEIIARISQRKDWTKNYNVILELVQNPKTPVKDAMSFVKQLHIKDLQLLSRDKNIAPTIRQLAMNYFREKSNVKQ